MPYAYGATITHEYIGNLLKIWLTFRHQMLRSSDPLATPPVYNIMPPLSTWLIEADAVLVACVASEWIDEFTLLLTSDAVASKPTQVTVEYTGPNANLAFRWGKNIEPWGPTISEDVGAFIEVDPIAMALLDQAVKTISDVLFGAGIFATALAKQFSVGTNTPDGVYKIHFKHTSSGSITRIMLFEFLVGTTNAINSPMTLKLTCTGDMADGFGPGFLYAIQDTAGVNRFIARAAAVRDGADNTGKFQIHVYTAGVATGMADFASSGIKIGMTTAQLLGFYGKAPVNQPDTVADPTDLPTSISAISSIIDRLQELGLIA